MPLPIDPNTAVAGGILDVIKSVFTGPAQVVKDATSFFQWISWVFNPLNWLRAVEFLLGVVMFGFGLWMAVTKKGGRDVSRSVGRGVRTFVRRIPE